MANSDVQLTGDIRSPQEKESELKIVLKFTECRVCSSDGNHNENRDGTYENNYGTRGCGQQSTAQRNGTLSEGILAGIDSTFVQDTQPGSSFLSPARKDSMTEPHENVKSESTLRKKKRRRKKRRTVTSGTLPQYPTDFSFLSTDDPSVSHLVIGDSNDMDSSTGTEYSSATSFALFEPRSSDDDERYLTLRGVGMTFGGTATDEEGSNYRLSTCPGSPNGTDYERNNETASAHTMNLEQSQVLFDENGLFIPPEKEKYSIDSLDCKVISSADYEDAKSRAFSRNHRIDGDVNRGSCDNIMDDYLGSSPITRKCIWTTYANYETLGNASLSSLLNSIEPLDAEKTHSKNIPATEFSRPTYDSPLEEEDGGNSRRIELKNSNQVGKSSSSSNWSDSQESGREYMLAKNTVLNEIDWFSDDASVPTSSALDSSFVKETSGNTIGSRATTTEETLKGKKKKKNKVLRFFQSVGKRIRKLKD